jgi:glycosyltransferase involved in cell wall biosynthesis
MADAFAAIYSTDAALVPVSNAFAVHASQEPASDRRTDVVSLVHVSNLSREKGTDLVLDAVGELRERGIECTLTLIGRVREPAIASKIEMTERLHPGCVAHLGEQDPAGVARALDRSHLMIFPSVYRNEAQPMVVLEALSRGVPALVSRRGSMVTMVPPDWQLDPDESAADGVQRMLKTDWSDLSRCARGRFDDMRSDESALLNALGLGRPA